MREETDYKELGGDIVSTTGSRYICFLGSHDHTEEEIAKVVSSMGFKEEYTWAEWQPQQLRVLVPTRLVVSPGDNGVVWLKLIGALEMAIVVGDIEISTRGEKLYSIVAITNECSVIDIDNLIVVD